MSYVSGNELFIVFGMGLVLLLIFSFEKKQMTEKSKYPLVSIITINFNEALVTCELIASLSRVSYPTIEIIVVDNASSTDGYFQIKEKYAWVKLLRSDTNLGFAGGNNLGLTKAQGKYILFLNNDTEVESGFLEPLVSAFENDPSLGLVSPQIRFFNSKHKQTIQYAGGKSINNFTGRGYYIGSGEQNRGQYQASKYTELIHGAAVLAPLSLLKEVGLMADIYFLYYEELDWCENVKRQGYKLGYVADSVVYHKASMSVGKVTGLKSYYMSRNRILYLRRNTKFFKAFIGIIFILLFNLPKTLIQHLLKNEFLLISEYLKGLWWNLVHYKGIKQTPYLQIDSEGRRKIVNHNLKLN